MSEKPTYEELVLRVKELEKEIDEQKIQESNPNSKIMAGLTFEGISIHQNGILIDANPQYFEMFGYQREELIGKQVIPLTVAQESIEKLKKQINTETTSLYEVLGLRKDGSKFPVEINAKYIDINCRVARFYP